MAVEKRKVFVKLLDPPLPGSKKLNEKDLFKHFGDLQGKIKDISIAKKKLHGFVEFTTPEAAKEAIAKYNGTKLFGVCKIKVKPYRQPIVEEVSSPEKKATHPQAKGARIEASAGSLAHKQSHRHHGSSNRTIQQPVPVEQFHPRRSRRIPSCPTAPQFPKSSCVGERSSQPEPLEQASISPTPDHCKLMPSDASEEKQPLVQSNQESPEMNWLDFMPVALAAPFMTPQPSHDPPTQSLQLPPLSFDPLPCNQPSLNVIPQPPNPLTPSLVVTQPAAPQPSPPLQHTCIPTQSLPPRYMMKRSVSAFFGKFLLVAATQECQKIGVSMEYSDSDGCLFVYANSPEKAREFVSQFLDRHCEYLIPLTLKKWNQLSELRSDGTTLFAELSVPFSTNPNVQIYLLPQNGSEKPSVVFVGTKSAVESAQLHFMGPLSREVEMSQTQAAALQDLFPDLSSQLHVKMSFTDATVCFEGSSAAVVQARNEVEKQISLLKLHHLPSSMSPSLLDSLKKRLQLEKVNACALHFPPAVPCLVTSSDQEYRRAMRVVGSICQRTHTLPSTELAEKLQSGSGLINSLERTHSVLTTIKDRVITVEGYIEEDVVAATENLISEVKALCITTRPIDCSPLIHSYLDLVLKQRDPDTLSFLSSLCVQVTFYEQQCILLKGTPAAISESEKLILDHFVPPRLKYRTFEFRCRFKSLIEDFLIAQLERMSTCRYLETENSSSATNTYHESSSSSSFFFTIFSPNIEHFEQMCHELQNLHPSTEKFHIHHSTVNLVKNRKRTLEQKYSVILEIHSESPTYVSIDGLQVEQVANCQKELEETLTVSKQISLKGFQVVYLKQNLQEKVAELMKVCYISQLPAVDRNKTGLLGNYVITVEGKHKDVEYIEKEMKEILADDMKHDTVFFSCQENMLKLWEKRWKQVLGKYESEHELLAWFSQNTAPTVNQSESNSITAQQSKPKEVETTFVVYGKSKSVEQLSKALGEIKNEGVLEAKLAVPADDMSVRVSLRTAIFGRDVDISLLKVAVEYPKGEPFVVLRAPCSCVDDFSAAKEMIEEFIERKLRRTKTIPCKEKLVAVILGKDQMRLQKTIPTDLKRKVTVSLQMTPPAIQLHGNQENILTAQVNVKALLDEIQDSLSTANVMLKPLLKPFFSSEEYPQLCSQLEQKHHVLVTCSCPIRPIKGANQVLCQSSFQPEADALCIQLSFIKGNILKEEVDAIVNAANPELKHTGGLAKAIADAGGDSIQKESMQYVKENGQLKPGDAVCLSSGSLPFQKLIHSVGPKWTGGTEGERINLRSAVYNSLCVANKENLKTIAIPALGTGVYQVPMSVCAQESHRAVVDFCKNDQNGQLKEVRFVLFTESDAHAFLKGFDLQTSREFLPSATVQDESATFALNWLWENDTHSFSPYDSSTSEQLSKNYQHNRHGTCTITVNRQQYKVDFASMTQTNLRTSFVQKVKVQDSRAASEQQQASSAQWYYEDDNGRYSTYTARDSAAIERCYTAGSVSSVITLTINGKQYNIDTVNMCQVNVQTHYKRRIKRELSKDTGAAQSAVTSRDEKDGSSESITVTLRGPRINLGEAEKVLREKLCSCTKTEILPLKGVSKSTKDSLQQIAQKHGITLEFSGKKRKSATIEGLTTVFDKALSEMQKLIIENMPEDETENPAEWEPQTKTVELFYIQKDSSEWREVSKMFKSTMCNANIHSIQRIQNELLWRKYTQQRKVMEAKNNGAVNEKELFHGTSQNEPRKIYDSDEGFDMRFSAKGMWGQANYFAVNASYSNGYAHTSTGYREMFLVKVLTGASFDCSSDSSLRMPPFKESAGGMQLGYLRYDTVTGVTGGSRVYMTYDNQKAYPAYLITYQ